MKNGTFIQEGRANINPTNKGLMAALVVRATPVIPAAAERSSARTTAIVYDCLVGTSIWLILKRTRRTKTASLRLGISGTRMSKMFEGRCVKTWCLQGPSARPGEMPVVRKSQQRAAPQWRSPDLKVIQQLGLEHEGAYLKYLQGLGFAVVRLSLIHISEPTRPLYISYAVFC